VIRRLNKEDAEARRQEEINKKRQATRKKNLEDKKQKMNGYC
jgi:hypothetical protein